MCTLLLRESKIYGQAKDYTARCCSRQRFQIYRNSLNPKQICDFFPEWQAVCTWTGAVRFLRRKNICDESQVF